MSLHLLSSSHLKGRSRLSVEISCAVVLILSAGHAAAQQTATSGRTITPEIEEILITERSLETSLPLELSRYGADLEIVTAEQVRNHGFVDVAQSLEMLVPGLHLTTQAGAFSYVNVAIQGGRPQDTLWTIDGVRINNRLYNSTSPADTLPSSMIERTEVLKGGHGLMYGTQAIAGVVNVVTRSFSTEPDAGFSVGSGSYGSKRVNGYSRGALGGHKFVAWASKDESDGYEIYDTYQPTSQFRDRGYNVESGGLKYGYDFTNDLRLSLMGIHTEARLDYPSVSNVSVNDRNEDIYSARLDYTPSEQTQFFLKSYFHDWDTDYFTPGTPTLYWGYEDIGASAGALFTPHTNFELHLGYDFQTYKGQDDVLLISGDREDVHAVYTQIRSTDALSERARFAAGARYNETGGVASTVWSTSGVYEISDDLYLQGIVATSFMLPSAENLYRIHCPSGLNCTHGNPELEPEESLGVTVSIGGNFAIMDSPLSWQLSTWDRRTDNLIQAAAIPAGFENPPPPQFTRVFINTPTEVKQTGAEILFRGPITEALSFDVSYTNSKEIAAGTNIQIRDRPRDQFKGSLAYVHPTLPFGVNIAFKYIGEKTSDVTGFGVQKYGDNYVVDAGAHVFLDGPDGNHRLNLRIENLLDEDYYTAVSSAVLTGSTQRFLYNRLAPPRIYSVNYSYTF